MVKNYILKRAYLVKRVALNQKDPLRLGSTSFGPIPELPWQVFDLKIH